MKTTCRSITPTNPRTAVSASALFLLACAFFSPAADAATGNTATGEGALLTNTGDYNTADGYYSLASSNSGAFNTAVGVNALYSNQDGADNVAVGGETTFQ